MYRLVRFILLFIFSLLIVRGRGELLAAPGFFTIFSFWTYPLYIENSFSYKALIAGLLRPFYIWHSSIIHLLAKYTKCINV